MANRLYQIEVQIMEVEGWLDRAIRNDKETEWIESQLKDLKNQYSKIEMELNQVIKYKDTTTGKIYDDFDEMYNDIEEQLVQDEVCCYDSEFGEVYDYIKCNMEEIR